jgi:hypothetical protein
VNKKLYLVETVSIFRMRYVVEAKEAGHANDEVVMNAGRTDDENWKEFSQKHVDECIVSTRELTQEEYIWTFNEDNDNLQNFTDEFKFKFINKIDYKE